MFEKIKSNWEKILYVVREELDLTDVSFNTWFVPLSPISLEKNVLTILFHGLDFSVKLINERYLPYIQGAIKMVTDLDVEIIIVSEQKKTTPEKQAASETIITNKLNKKYTFDSFVVGGSNNVAHAASLAVAEAPGDIYNPLFIYGGVGLGKTHLMQAIALFALNKNPNASVIYTSCEKFTNELVDAIYKNKTASFREKYRSVDLLIIDDIQFLSGKENTKEEIFNTFNTLYESGKQIVFASDRSPNEIEDIDERISSRFMSGLTVKISAPDYETRMAILRKKEEEEGYNIDNSVINFIASNIKSNIRELEAALKKVVAYSKLENSEIDVAFAEKVLKDNISSKDNLTLDRIIETVADHFGIRVSDLTSVKRSNSVAYPRQIAMYLCDDLTDATLTDIARVLKKKDHSTIIYGRDKISEEIEKDANLKNTIEILKNKLSC